MPSPPTPWSVSRPRRLRRRTSAARPSPPPPPIRPTESNISSAGNYIGGASDQFNFDYQLQTGNFDVTVCLAGLGLSDLWAEAGLMARASLNAGSPFAAALATPGMNGDFFADRTATNGRGRHFGKFSCQLSQHLAAAQSRRQCVHRLCQLRRDQLDAIGRRQPLPCPARFTSAWPWPATTPTSRPRRNLSTYETTPTNAVVAAHRQSPRTAGAVQPQDRDCHFRNHVEARPAHRRQQHGVSGNLQFLSVFPGHQRLSGDVRGHELHLSRPTRSFPAAPFSSWRLRRKASPMFMA